MQRGRPTEYDPKYCDTIVEVMSTGKSLAGAAVHIGVTRATLYNWARDNEEFRQAIEDAQEACMAYWEELAHQAVLGEIPGNASIMNFQLKNRFRKDYQDSTAMTLSGGDDPLKIDEKRTIEFILPEVKDG